MPETKSSWLPTCRSAPSMNVRDEFRAGSQWLRSPKFSDQLKDLSRREAHVWNPLLDWHGDAEGIITLLTQRQFLGLEAYMCLSARARIMFSSRLTLDEKQKLVRGAENPFSIRGKDSARGTAAQFYHHLPQLIHPELTLKSDGDDFWERLTIVYRELRNPIMHGAVVSTRDPKDVHAALDVLDEVFEWIEKWALPMGPTPEFLSFRSRDTGETFTFPLMSRGPRAPK